MESLQWSRSAILAAARVAGVTVSRHQWERWRAARLLPAPHRISQGRGRGVVSVYPGLTVVQLHAITQVLADQRNVEVGLWRLWFLGFAVTPAVRQLLLDTIDTTTAGRRDQLHGWEHEQDGAPRRRARRRDREGTLAKRRLGQDAALTFGRMVGELLVGEGEEEGPYDDIELDIFADGWRAMGWMPSDLGPATKRQWRDGWRQVVHQLGAWMHPEALRQQVGVTDAELESLRDDFRAFRVVRSAGRPLRAFPARRTFLTWLQQRPAFPDLVPFYRVLRENPLAVSLRESRVDALARISPEAAAMIAEARTWPHQDAPRTRRASPRRARKT